MRRRPRRSLLALGALVGGCGPQAELRPICAPHDAPAVMLSVTPAGGRYFRLRVFRPLAEMAGRRIELPAASAGVPAAEWCEASGCELLRAGATLVEFGALRADSSMAVQVRTARPDGSPFRWSGVAHWHGATLACG